MLRVFPQKKFSEKDPDWIDWLGKLRDHVNFGEPPSDVVEITNNESIGIISSLMRVISKTAGNVTALGITTGHYDGQNFSIEGSDDTRTVTLIDGNGIKLINGNMILKENYIIKFHYNATKKLWIENYRNKL
jgi:hypothetical protein